MSHIPSLRRRPSRAKSFPYIDTLFDYGAFLQGAPASLGTLPAEALREPIAVIGAGIGGLTAAYELLRAGARNVTVFEATSRAGGRVFSQPFTTQRPEFLAELGAMRFPPSEFGLFHYLDKFGIQHVPNFPDPGKVLTNVGYQGKTYTWAPDSKQPPPIFARVSNGWDHFVSDGFQVPGGPRLASPSSITSLLEAGNYEAAAAAWRSYIGVFESLSFYAGLVQMFTSANPPGGARWQASDFELFGALGLGSGGFGPLYPIGFLELLRLIVNELETDQEMVLGGIQSLAKAFCMQQIHGVQLGNCVRLDTAVTGITRGPGGKPVLHLSNGSSQHFARAVVAATNRSMKIDMDLGNNVQLLNATERSALGGVHMTSSSKVFVLTADKFWRIRAGLPANIQTDTLVRGVYCLDYTPEEIHGPGVVLLSYTWEDDSIEQMALRGKRARVERLVADVARTNADFARHVVPIDGDYERYTQVIDWDLEPHYYGAFKLNYPGDDQASRALFYQYLCCKSPASDIFTYLAGDSQSFTGGWIEGAVQTGVNAACAVIHSFGGKFYTPANPIDAARADTYEYAPT